MWRSSNPGAACCVLPTSRKVREKWGTLFVGCACEIKSRANPLKSKAGSSPVLCTGSE